MSVEKNDFIIDFSDPEQKQNYINYINSLESQYKIQHEQSSLPQSKASRPRVIRRSVT